MNYVKKAFGYPLAAIGGFFLFAAVLVLFDDLPRSEKNGAFIGCLLIGGGLGVPGVLLVRSGQSGKREAKVKALESEQARLRSVLYQMIEQENGEFTLVQFAIAANLPAEEAKAFLEPQAMAFDASFDVSEQGSIVYQFPVS